VQTPCSHQGRVAVAQFFLSPISRIWHWRETEFGIDMKRNFMLAYNRI